MRVWQALAAMILSPALLLAGSVLFASGSAMAGPALLFDPEDGKILYAEDPDSQWHPASLTKIMTAYLTFEAVKTGKLTLATKIACSANANKEQPSKLGLPIGAEITVEVALQALIIKSANDVAIMLAEAVAGSDAAFVAQMNATARRLGMTRTTFVNPNGLPTQEQMTTARDLAKLGRAVVKDYPEYAPYWAMQEARIGKTRLTTHNGLLKSFEGADGLKTGFICDSGFNIVASATRDGKKLMAVVLGEQTGADRTLRASSLLEHGFQQLGWKQMFNTNNIDNLPLAADVKGITSMRQSVVSWECGTGRAGRSAARKSRVKAAKAAKAVKAAKVIEQGAGTKVTSAKPAAAATAKAALPVVKAAKPAPAAGAGVAEVEAAPAKAPAPAAPAAATPVASPAPAPPAEVPAPAAAAKEGNAAD